MDITDVRSSLLAIIKNVSKGPQGHLVTIGTLFGLTCLLIALVDGVSFHNSTIGISINSDPSKILLTIGLLYTITGISAGLFKYIEGDKAFNQNLEFDKLKSESEIRIENLRAKINKANDTIFTNIGGTDNKEENKAGGSTDTSHKPSVDIDYQTIAKTLSLLKEREEKISANNIKIDSLDQIDKHIRDLQAGVNNQIDRLSRSGTINLIIGLMTTLVAIGVLISLVLTAKTNSFIGTKDFLIYSIPRVSLALFIELFSFFFLRLYKANLDDVKYFHNERTNIDSKIIALKLFLSLDDSRLSINVIKSFLSVERNFILKKDETTIGIENAKINNQQEADLLSKVASIIEKVRK